MSICTLSLISLALIPIALFVFKKPSKQEIKKNEYHNNHNNNSNSIQIFHIYYKYKIELMVNSYL